MDSMRASERLTGGIFLCLSACKSRPSQLFGGVKINTGLGRRRLTRSRWAFHDILMPVFCRNGVTPASCTFDLAPANQHPTLLTRSSDYSMSQITPTPSTSSSSNFQSIFNAALERYDNKTRNKLFTHPLASQFQSCDSPAAVLSLLQELVQQFDQGRGSYQRLSNWLNPTVNVLFALSATLGEGVGLVRLN